MHQAGGDRSLAFPGAANLNLSNRVNKRYAVEKVRSSGGPSANVGAAKRGAKTSKQTAPRAKHSEAMAEAGEKAVATDKGHRLRHGKDIAHFYQQSSMASQAHTTRGGVSDNMSTKKNTRRKVGSKSAKK